MSTTLQELLNTNNPIRADSSSANTDINLTAGLASTACALCSVALSNVQGDSHGLGYPEVLGRLSLASAAFGANAAVYGWFILESDGSNYETVLQTTGTTTTPPCAKPADFIWAIDNKTQASIRDAWAAQGAPICAAFKLLVWNNTGIAFASTGNSINLYYATEQLN